MATPAEKKALLFVAAVALLGTGTRVWHTWNPLESDAIQHEHDTPGRSSGKQNKASKSQRTKAENPPDSTTIDLDVASWDEINALGVIKPSQARMLVQNRERWGPFGSLSALERIPYFPKSAITKLAPHATFSRRPRSEQAVVGAIPSVKPLARAPKAKSAKKDLSAPKPPGHISATQPAVESPSGTTKNRPVIDPDNRPAPINNTPVPDGMFRRRSTL